MLKFLTFCALLGAQTLFAFVEFEVSSKTSPEVVFSSSSPNRICCEEGSITGIHFDENRFHGSIGERTGEAFLIAKRGGETPSLITLSTSFGETQSLLVSTKEAPGEIVFLKRGAEAKKEEQTADALPPLSTDFHSNTVAMLNAILDYRAPSGFAIREIEKMPDFLAPENLTSEPLFFYEGPFDQLLVFLLENPFNKPVSIDVNTMKSGAERWIFCPNRWLVPQEKCLLIVCKERKDV